MKKQIKSASPAGRKLNLIKRTISNLEVSEMTKRIGGNPTNGQNCNTIGGGGPPFTKRCNTF